MKTARRFRFPGLLALTLAGTAHAGPTAVTATPNPARTNQQVAIQVTGNGACGQMGLKFGDGQSHSFSNVNFPLKVMHTYANQGSFQVTATGQKGTCSGEASTTLSVKSLVLKITPIAVPAAPSKP